MTIYHQVALEALFFLVAVLLILRATLREKSTGVEDASIQSGFYYAYKTFAHSTFNDAIEELREFVLMSNVEGAYSEFDEGIEKYVKQHISDQCDIFNRQQGGDWYFCEEALKFKDSLTSREISL